VYSHTGKLQYLETLDLHNNEVRIPARFRLFEGPCNSATWSLLGACTFLCGVRTISPPQPPLPWQLEILPLRLGSCAALHTLIISENVHISTLPTSMKKLMFLKVLHVDGRSLEPKVGLLLCFHRISK
jgi:hypothetical protein